MVSNASTASPKWFVHGFKCVNCIPEMVCPWFQTRQLPFTQPSPKCKVLPRRKKAFSRVATPPKIAKAYFLWNLKCVVESSSGRGRGRGLAVGGGDEWTRTGMGGTSADGNVGVRARAHTRRCARTLRTRARTRARAQARAGARAQTSKPASKQASKQAGRQASSKQAGKRASERASERASMQASK